MSERRVFTVATVVLLVHALDDALVNRQPGIGVGQHAVAALVALVAGGAAIAAFPSLRPGLRDLGGQRVRVRFDHGTEPIGFQVYRSIRQVFLRLFDV